MKNILKTAMFFILLSAVCGCITADPGYDDENNAVCGREYAVKKGERIVKSVINGDYREFAINAGEKISFRDEKAFSDSRENICRSMGEFSSFRFLGELQSPLVDNQLYAVRFKKKGADGKIVEHEQLLQLLFARADKNCTLLGMRFIE